VIERERCQVKSLMSRVEQQQEKREKRNTLGVYTPEHIHGEVIGKIASSFYYVNCDERVDDVADELNLHEDIFAVGVVNGARKAIGVIVRKELFDTLSKQYGRALYRDKNIGSMMMQTTMFHYRANVLSVTDELSTFLSTQAIRYYLLLNDSGEFAGIFSSKDLLIYLSSITQKDILLAKHLQLCIVREELEYREDRCHFFGAVKMAKGVGGDFYSIQQYAQGKWIVSICDVAGKGMPAALISVLLSGMSSVFNFSDGLREYLNRLNKYIYNTFNLESFLTGIFIDFDDTMGKIQIFDMGHSYCFLYRNGQLMQIKSRNDNMPIGIREDLDPKMNRYTLIEGDLLILLTDGIEEQKNPQGEIYGMNRVYRVIKKYGGNGLKRIKDELISDHELFRKNQPQRDDMTMIFLRYTGKPLHAR